MIFERGSVGDSAVEGVCADRGSGRGSLRAIGLPSKQIPTAWTAVNAYRTRLVMAFTLSEPEFGIRQQLPIPYVDITANSIYIRVLQTKAMGWMLNRGPWAGSKEE